MKKTFRFLSMAAFLVVGAIMTGCSNDDNIDTPQQSENKDNVVALTATVSLDAVNGSTGAKTFEGTNQIAVIYKDGENKTKKAVSTDFTPTGDKTKATFTVTLSNPANNSAIRYIYPATMAKDVAEDATITDDDATIDYTGLLNSQDGDLTNLGTNYDLAVKDSNLSGTALPESVTLTNPLAICKFTLTDGYSPITSSVYSLTISDGTNAYVVSPSGLDAIYVAMKPASGNIAFTVFTFDLEIYFKTATGISITASTLYTDITVSMVKLEVGRVFCSDGSVYASKDDATKDGKTAVAMICFLGLRTDNDTYTNGLAIALDDESGTMNWSTAKSTCEGKSFVSGAWCLPSKDQWKMMLWGTGGHEEESRRLNETITRRGGTALQEDSYWMSDERDSENAYIVLFKDSRDVKFGDDKFKDNSYRVRACLAF